MPFINAEWPLHGLPYGLSIVALLVCLVAAVLILHNAIKKHDKEAFAEGTVNTFPRRLLAFTMSLTLIIIIWFGANSIYIYHFLVERLHTDVEASLINKEILHLHGLKHNDIVMVALSPDPRWVERYFKDTSALIFAIDRLASTSHTPAQQSNVDLAKHKGKIVERIESAIIEKSKEGRIEASKEILISEEYLTAYSEAATGLFNLTKTSHQVSEQRLTSIASSIFISIHLILFSGCFLLCAWFFALRSIRIWQNELETTKETLAMRITEKEYMELQLAGYVQSMERAQKEIVAARKQAENEARAIALLKSVAATANKTSDIRVALSTILELICTYVGFPLGHVYAVDDKNNVLRSTKIWFISKIRKFDHFIKVSEEISFKEGEGLPGLAWKKKSAVWIDDRDNLTNSPRVAAMPDMPVRSGFAFPIQFHDKTAYVLEFFSMTVTQPDIHLMDILKEVSNQLVLVIERRQTEIALQQSKNDAEAANAAKSDFLANMSHEIRTPMNGLLGMLNLVTDTELSKQQKEWIEIARGSAESLLDIINDILDLSKIEAGELVTERIPFNLSGNIESVTDLLSAKARNKNIRLLVEVDAKTPRFVIGDPLRIRQVLINLIGNALKFTEKGHIILRILPSQTQPGMTRFEVEDTGIGIAENKLSYIFNKFSQEHESTTRRFGGTGLGLTISKKLVGLMGGEIGVISSLGKGSLFWFELPLEPDPSHATSTQPIIDLAQTRSLIVEFYPPSREILSNYMESWGLRYSAMSDSQAAINALASASAEHNPYHFVLIDGEMPGNAWVELAEKISEMALSNDTILILCAPPGLALHPNALSTKKIAAIINKPVFSSELFDTMHYLWQNRGQQEPMNLVTRSSLPGKGRILGENNMAQPASYPGLRILLVEDQSVNQLLMKTVLEKLQCVVEIANNGKEALDLIKLNAFDIILMDCHMPEMDGFEATQHIRAYEAPLGRKTPIIALTADAMQGDKDKCLAVGMDDYINKPIRTQRLHEVLDKFTGRTQE